MTSMCTRRIVPLLALAGALWAAAQATASPSKRPFYVIAHMTNTLDSVRWALAEGANGVEMDLRFTDRGEPLEFRHGSPSDCTCNLVPSRRHICSQLGGGSSVGVGPMFNLLAKQPKVALVILDTKLDGAAAMTMQEAAGTNIVRFMDRELFAKGYRGKVIVSVASADALAYLKKAALAASTSPNRARISFAIDQVGKSAKEAACALKTLTSVASKNRVFGTGISGCALGDFSPAISAAVANQRSGGLGLVYVWTLDKQSSMRTYVDLGVNGILTNAPSELLAVARQRGLTLATPDSPIPSATNDAVAGASACGCDCDYHPGGCVISKPAASGSACKCSYKGGWTCGGSVTACRSSSSALCRSPDTSVASCVQGGGDCDGYKQATCDCNYERGGCYISRVAPRGTACKCNYKGAWTCGGSVVRCRNESSAKCANPDKSKAACQLGGGDCQAKRYK